MLTQTQARQALDALVHKYHQYTHEDRPRFTEADVVHHFIRPFLGAVLGWPVDEPERYTYELHTPAGRPDITRRQQWMREDDSARFTVLPRLHEQPPLYLRVR